MPDVLRTCQLSGGSEDGRKDLKELKVETITHLVDHLKDRFSSVLDHPMIHAFSVFDFRHWPSDTAALSTFGITLITELFYNYKSWFEDATKEEVLEQWSDLKTTVNSSVGLKALPFKEMWARMITSFSDVENGFFFVLRLVVFMLLIVPDTSECERLFSLMNNIETADRTSLGHTTLNNLMQWHYHGKIKVKGKGAIAADMTPTEEKYKALPFDQLDVMDIIKRWRAQPAVQQRGRRTHRPAAPPVYPWKKDSSLVD